MSTPSPDELVIVSGLPRSGTSLLMQMLAAGGLEVVADRHRPPDPHNPRGYFEDARVLRLDRDTSWLPEARGKVVKVVATSLHLLPGTERYRVLLMQRPLSEVLASQRAMLGATEAPSPSEDAHARQWFERFLQDLGTALRAAPNIEPLEVHYHDLLQHPREQAKRIASFLGRNLDTEAMAAAVDPSLYRQRSAP